MIKTALLSVSNKTGLLDLARSLFCHGFRLVASGGTAMTLRDASLAVIEVSELTGSPEILGGRVKTLHPVVHGGILARDIPSDKSDLERLKIDFIDVVVCNLYPFEKTVANPDCSLANAIEEIDIGGVTLLRAAAKNHERVSILCDPNDYSSFIEELTSQSTSKITGAISKTTRRRLALKAFDHTAAYDSAIASHLRSTFSDVQQPVLSLRYGMNPHQSFAQAYLKSGLAVANSLPFRVLNGAPGFINLLDALNAWALVRELALSTNRPAAASFKHVSPAGAAVGLPLDPTEIEALMIPADGSTGAVEMSLQAVAYARARGADAVSSFGDFAALSSECDESTALLLSREVSDGVIAPSFSAAALKILAAKKQGRYCVLQIDPGFVPPEREARDVFGVTLEQTRNNSIITAGDAAAFFGNIVSPRDSASSTLKSSVLPASAVEDLLVATVTAKYTMSNSIVYAKRGMAIGVGAGQQSRLHCTALAGGKADTWLLRQHPKALAALKMFKPIAKRAQRASAIAAYVQNSGALDASLFFDNVLPTPMTEGERREWLDSVTGVALSSDAFFPFSDSLYRARASGVEYVAAPSGSVNDNEVIAAAEKLGMKLCFTNMRLFHH